MNEIFKKGDTVYHYRHGKAIITNCYHTLATVQCEADDKYIDLMNDETIFDDDYLTAGDMLESLDQMPDIYWVEQTAAKIKYDDGDLDNCKIIKTYKLGS